MTYELWDGLSRNLIDEFATEAEALAVARAYLTPDEGGVTIPVGIVVYDDDGPVRSIWDEELVSLAFGPRGDEAIRTS